MTKVAQPGTAITELRPLLEYFNELIEAVKDPFIILNNDLVVVVANRSFYRMFKVHKEATIGRLIYELGDNQWDSPRLRRLLEDIIPKHKVLNDFAVTHDFPGVGSRTILLNARRVDSKGLILLSMQDVTAQWKIKFDSKEKTAELHRQQAKLQDLQDDKDDFISLAAHQLRTPATAVKQYLGMLNLGYAGKLSDDQLKMLEVANANNERELEIFEDLLRVAKVHTGKVYLEKSLCDVVSQVEGAVRAQANAFASRHQSVIFQKPKEKVFADIDPKLMRMVIEDLLDNAGKYSLGSAQVTITITQSDECTCISITDTGVGIRKSDLPKLFREFSRINNPLSVSTRGTGLGLYWAKKVLDLHQGSIEVISRLNKGSTFVIKLPN
jgi:two-component system CheB/CheR fusion protein